MRVGRPGLPDGRPARARRRRDARALGGLELGYTESTGHPLLRREIAALYETIEPDEVLTFAGAEEAIFCLVNVLLGPGDHAIVTWPGYQSLYEVGAGGRRRRHAPRAPRGDGWALDIDLLRGQVDAGDAPHRRQRAAQPDRDAARPGDLRRARRDRRGAGAHLLIDEVYRGLEFDEADRLPAGADASTGHLARRDVEVVRDGRAAHRLAGDARPGPAGRLRRVQGLHDDLLVGAVGDPGDHRAACPRRVLARSRAIVAATSRTSTGSSTLGGPLHVGPAARRVGRLPAADRAGRAHRRLGGDLVEAEGVLLLPGSQFGHPGNHFRIGFGRTDLPEALARLEAFAERTLR